MEPSFPFPKKRFGSSLRRVAVVCVALLLVGFLCVPAALGNPEPSSSTIDPSLDYADGELIITYDNAAESGVSTFSLEESANPRETLDQMDIRVVEEIAPATQAVGTVVSAQVPTDLSLEQAMQQLSQTEGIASVQPNYVYHLIDSRDDGGDSGATASDSGAVLSLEDAAATSALPNDPYCVNTTAANNQYYLYNSKVVDAWDKVQCNGTVTVAVLDTGCYMDHEDLAGTVDAANAYDIYNDRPLSESTAISGDALGHGTHVCGIVAAQANNGIGVAGASYNANVLPVKVFNDGTSSTTATASTTDIVKGYTYLASLVDNGTLNDLRVINMSLGFYPSNPATVDPVFENAIKNLRNNYGVLSVCAGGNGDTNGNPLTGVSYPSDYDACLAVTSLDRDGGNTYWSDYNQYKDISAPGTFIRSTGNATSALYTTKSGTSMASPLVAGSAALLWAANPDLSVDEAVNALEGTADPINDSEYDRTTTSGSAGALNVAAAVDSVIPDVPDPDPDPTTETANASNLVVFVNFSDTTGISATGYNAAYPYYSEANGIRTKWEYLKKRFNEKNMDYTTTFRDYLGIISSGNHDVLSVFPQDNADAGTVSYITLDNPCSYYADYDAQGNDYALVSDTIAKLNATYPDLDTSTIDLNADGVVDNLLIVPTAKADGTFTSHKSVAAGWSSQVGSTAAKDVVSYNVVETTFDDSSGSVMDSLDYETVAHEYLHSLGVPDLYRRWGNTAGSPVGVWDIMATSGARSWPLAVTREQLGWTSIADRTGVGSYTLYAPDSGNEQAIVLKSPLSESEYFVVEYRRKNTGVTACDTRIGGSGLIVYRVNPAYVEEGNAGGNDYIYVFRNGETGISDSAGDVANAQVGTESYGAPRQSIGSADMTADITEGALCYSDGRNSGITIRAVDQADGSITFDVSYPDYESLGYWDEATNADGTSLLPTANVTALDTATDGSKVYTLAGTTDYVNGSTQQGVWCYDGTSWNSLGSVSNDLSNASLACIDGEVYMLGASYVEGSSSVVLKRYTGSAWQEVTRVLTGSNYANVSTMGVVDGSLYVLVDKNNADAQLYKLQGTTLNAVGSVLPVSYLVHPEIVKLPGGVGVACGNFSFDVSSSSSTQVYGLSSQGSWNKVVDRSGEAPVAVSGATANGKTYVLCSYNTSDPVLYVIGEDGTVEAERSYDQLAGCRLDSCVAAGSDYVYLSLIDGDSVVKTYAVSQGDTASLELLGAEVYSPGTDISSVLMGGNVYCGVINSSTGAANLRMHAGLDEERIVPSVGYQTHIQDYGWQSVVRDGATSGTTGEFKRLEGIKLSLSDSSYAGSIQYQTHIQDYGWESNWKSDGAISGTTGESKRLEAIRIQLDGEIADSYDVYYRVHAQEFGWMDWAKNGESAGTAGYSYRLEAIQVQVVPKDADFTGSTDMPFASTFLNCQTHVQDYGWQDAVHNGGTSGTTGQSKRLEGIKIVLSGLETPGSIRYQTHIQGYGWESDWKYNGALSGTTGESRRLEAIRIQLDGEIADSYDVYYRVHAQEFGWMGWAKNGESAGTAGYSYRLEAIQVQLVKKGDPAPGPMDGAFRQQ